MPKKENAKDKKSIEKEEFKEINLEKNGFIDGNEEKKNLEIKQMQSKQVMWVVVLMVSVVLIIIAGPFITKNFINKFMYAKLEFYKTKMGEIVFYSAKIPLTDSKMNIINDYNLNLRNDPRKLKEMETNVPENKVAFKKFNPVYISLEANSTPCEDNVIAVVGLTGFLRDFGNLKVKSAMDDKAYANETKLPYVVCGTNPENTVIHLASGNSTKIKKINDDCYELTYSNCEINQVTERFILIILEDYMTYFERK
jgi:hypothetical protein